MILFRGTGLDGRGFVGSDVALDDLGWMLWNTGESQAQSETEVEIFFWGNEMCSSFVPFIALEYIKIILNTTPSNQVSKPQT